MKEKRELTRADEIKGTRIFLTIFALFWNGIVITAIVAILNSTDSGGSDSLFTLLFLVPFVLVGLGVAYLAISPSALAKITPSQTQRTSGLPSISAPVATDRSGNIELKPSVSPVGKLIGMICIALFWNGIVSVFLVELFKSYSKGHPDWFLSIFLIPFVLVGLAFIGGVIYFLLALSNPRPTLKLKSKRIKPGEKFDVSWQLSGSVDRIESMRVYLEGREEATYTRGTTTTTDKSVFSTIELLETRGSSRMRRGNITASLPEITMHSFDGNNNKIKWHICIHGEIPKWPDVKEEFEITVAPLEMEQLKRLT